MLFVKICISDWKNESRDERELFVAKKAGFDVTVVAKGHMNGKKQAKDVVAGFDVIRLSSHPYNRIPPVLNKVLAIAYWGKTVRKLEADVISGHDIFGLLIGWLSTLNSKKKTLLIYDSHEYELGRNKKRNQLQKVFIKYMERFLCKKSDLIIVVNESIAALLTKLHNLKKKPLIIRNIPDEFQPYTQREVDDIRAIYQSEFGDGYILSYHGIIQNGRGLEILLEVLRRDEKLKLVIIGNAPNESYKHHLIQQAENWNVKNQVLFHQAVPHDQLGKYISAADLSMVLIEPISESYYYALPNKLFESINAGTPVVGSDLPEIRKIITKYHIGIICDYNNIDSLINSIKHLLSNQAAYKACKENMINACADLNWTKEQEILLLAYKDLMREAGKCGRK